MVRPWLQRSPSNLLLWPILCLPSPGSRVDPWVQGTLAHLVFAESWVTGGLLGTGTVQKCSWLWGSLQAHTLPHSVTRAEIAPA